jgi:S-adenosylmethionine-dependent methyltransferase
MLDGQLTDLFGGAAFEVILCHNLLEYVDDPTLVLRGAARTLRGNSAILSIVVRNQMGEVFKAAIQAGDLTAAETNLSAEWGFESLYGGRVRLFTSVGLRAMSTSRVVADYSPPNISRTAPYERIFELERTLGAQPEFAAIARYTHCLARRRENCR